MTREEIIEGLNDIHAVTANYKGDQVILHSMPMKKLTGILYGAAELLEAQEPRVMTLEEVQALRVNDVVWLEDKGKPNIIPGIVRNRHLWPHSATMVTTFMRGDGCKVTADDDDYGKRWRCWTSCPTDDQREATPLG